MTSRFGALAIVYRIIATHLINKVGVSRNTARTGALTLIQQVWGQQVWGQVLQCSTRLMGHGKIVFECSPEDLRNIQQIRR